MAICKCNPCPDPVPTVLWPYETAWCYLCGKTRDYDSAAAPAEPSVTRLCELDHPRQGGHFVLPSAAQNVCSACGLTRYGREYDLE